MAFRRSNQERMMKSGLKGLAAVLLLAFTGATSAEEGMLQDPDVIIYQMATQAFGVSKQATFAAAQLATQEADRHNGKKDQDLRAIDHQGR